MFRTVFLVATMFLLSSCSFYKVDSDLTSTQFHPSKGSTSEVTYLEVVSQPYDVIGTVTVNAERNQRLNDVIERMKREAAGMGGDAITNIRTNAGTGKWAKIKPKKLFGNANVRTNFIADVIAYKTTPGA